MILLEEEKSQFSDSEEALFLLYVYLIIFGEQILKYAFLVIDKYI